MGYKEDYNHRDRLIRVITRDGKFRCSFVKTTSLVNEAINRHHLNPLASVILGELLTGAVLSGSTLKGGERISFRIESNGDIGMAVAEAGVEGEVRGYITNTQPVPQDEDPARMKEKAIGVGLLHVTRIIHDNARALHSTVMLEHSNITKDLTHYFAVSEQIPTAMKLEVDFNSDFSVKHAVGLLIQAMPGADKEEIIQIEKNIIDLPRFSEKMDQGETISQVAEHILRGEPYDELSRVPVDFFCRCSKERFLANLLLLPLNDLEELSEEGEELRCHYCNSRYQISSMEIADLITRKKKGGNEKD